MATRSLEQVRNDYVSVMGEDLGIYFFELYVSLFELHAVWQQYQQLFCSNHETVQLLNRTAGLFFKIIQNELWNSVILGICRMTDSASTGSNKNLTIQRLPKLIEDVGLKSEVQELCNEAINASKFAREYRNKRIAHQDFNFETNQRAYLHIKKDKGKVETVLSLLRQVLNSIDNFFRDCDIRYEIFVDASGGRLLIQKLKELEELKKHSSSMV